jgi:hypothetical protein
MAPEVGLEPTTERLTVEFSADADALTESSASIISLFPTAWVFAIGATNAYRSTYGRPAGRNLPE